MTPNKTLFSLLNELLEKVKEVKHHLVYEYNERKREWGEIKAYLEMLSHIEEIIDTYN